MNGRRILWVLLLAATIPYFVNLGATSIIDANEAFYTETPREMLEHGTWLNSTFNYEPRFNKPPLSYWAVLALYKTVGVSLWASRLPIALGALVMIATAFVLARVVWGTRAAWVAAVTLAATPRFLLFARRILIDVWSSMFLGLTLVCFVLAETDSRRRRRWLVLMYVSAALGVLTKGPVAVVIPALVFGVYLLVSGRLGTIRSLMLPAGAVIVAALVAPYYVAVYAAFGWDHIATFFLRENLARYADGVGAPSRGPLFYLPVVFVDFYFPWSVLLPVAFFLVPWRRLRSRWDVVRWRQAWRTSVSPASPEDIRLLLGLWIVLIVGFYSFSRGQQDLYVLPFIPAAAALVGGVVTSVETRAVSTRLTAWTVGLTWLMAGLLVVLGLGTFGGLAWAGSSFGLRGAMAAAAVMAVAALAACVPLRQKALLPAVLILVTGVAAVQWLTTLVIMPDFERYKPVPAVARVITALPEPAGHVATYKVAAPSLVFYLGRHVEQLFDVSQLESFLNSDGSRYCMMHDTDYRALPREVVSRVRVVATVPRFWTRFDDILERRGVLATMVLVAGVDP